jgi:serine/threonine-protein kinase
MRLAAGETFGRYTIVALIGKGGSGHVYRARDEQLQRDVALKVLEGSSEDSPDTARRQSARVLREARAAAAIQHENAVAIHDVGEIAGKPFITMELVDGASLRAFVGDASVSIEKRIAWLVQIASALQAAHDRHIVHRDVKPENVMVRSDGVIKVLDFGIARPESERKHDDDDELHAHAPHDAHAPPGATTEATWAGTPRYMSPEQLRRSPIDARSDQFSWGVLAHEVLTGDRPWKGDALSLSGIASVMQDDVDIEKLRASCPSVVANVVLRTLAKAPEDRFDSMRDVIRALDGRVVRRARPLVVLGVSLLGVVTVTAAVLAMRARPTALRAHPMPVVSVPVNQPSDEANLSPPNVLLLLDAAQGVEKRGNSITAWRDQSGSGNDAIAGKVAPTWIAATSESEPAIHFRGEACMTIADAPTLRIGLRDFVILVVARHNRPPADPSSPAYTIATGYGALFGKTEPQHPHRGIGLFVNYPFPGTGFSGQTTIEHCATSAMDGLNDNHWHLFGVSRTGTTLEVRVDGTKQGELQTERDDVSALGVNAYLGGHPIEDNAVVQQLAGDIAFVYLARTMFPDHLARIEASLTSRYGIARPAPREAAPSDSR